MKIDLRQGDCLELMKDIHNGSIDSIVCDPPYEINFMGKGWDNSGIAFDKNTWKLCYDTLKEGGYLLAFGGSRTFHRIACAIEDAGFEIRDTIMWLYGSGFPKSMNVGLAIDKRNGVENRTGNIVKGVGSNNTFSMGNSLGENREFSKQYEERIAKNEWVGWGTCLKPAYEPIIVARKPFKGSLVDNVIQYGVGGINIDECRVGKECEKEANGRFPANVILTYDETDFKEVCGGMPDTKSVKSNRGGATNDGNSVFGKYDNLKGYECGFNDEGSASRYFYCAKASKKDRDEGLEDFENRIVNDDRKTPRKNIHPTVKPTTLMRYLVRLVTPKGGTVCDPFMGSGSTGKAVMIENKERDANYNFVGIELDENYFNIAKKRIEGAINGEEADK